MSERQNCRDRDPALAIFHSLPTLEVAADEIEAMKGAVAAMRRAEKHSVPLRRRPVSVWARAAAVAAVLLTAVLLRGAAPPADGPNAGVGPAAEVLIVQPRLDDAAVQLVDYASYVTQLPLIDGLEEPLLQFHDEGLSLVFVASEHLDV